MATEACQGSTQTLLREAPKDSVRWVLMLIPPSLQMRQPPQVTQGVSVRGERRQASAGEAAGASQDGVTWGRTGRGALWRGQAGRG